MQKNVKSEHHDVTSTPGTPAVNDHIPFNFSDSDDSILSPPIKKKVKKDVPTLRKVLQGKENGDADKMESCPEFLKRLQMEKKFIEG